MILDFRPVSGTASNRSGMGRRGPSAIVDFERRRARVESRAHLVEEAKDLLEVSCEELSRLAFEIALADSWYDWDQTVPVGTAIEIGPGELLSCTDPFVRRLAAVLMAIQDVTVEDSPLSLQ